MISHICHQCGKEFGAYPYRVPKYCSQTCHADARTDRHRLKFKAALKAVVEAGERSRCIEWPGRVEEAGYGSVGYSRRSGRATAHRLSFEIFVDPIPDGMWVLHRCDNRRCCNPDHLFLGTSPSNTADRHDKGRDAKGEANGWSKLTVDQVERIKRGSEAAAALAREFGVRRQTVGKIRRGQTWRHI